MDTPAAKRQLLTAANLAKPFRSPLKRRPIDCEPKNDGASGLKRSGLHHTTSSDTTPLPRKLPRTTFNSPSITASFNADPDIAHLIKAQRQLEKQLREVKDELDEARQARKIESDSTKQDPYGEVDGELKALKQKWKEASRLAAEDLFTDVRDRVNRYATSVRYFILPADNEQNGWSKSLEGNARKTETVSARIRRRT